jgi:hypothetical protein
MCALLRYSAGGLAALLTTAYVAVSAETGVGAFQTAVFEPASVGQTVVNRAAKGDRELTVRNARGPAAPAAAKPPKGKESKILEGCDPAFSPLTSSAKNNFANRCLV